MARFTQEQIEEIKNSEEFKQYLEIAGEDETNLALTHYLQNARNEAFWANQFSRREQNEANEAQDNNQMPREYSAADIDRYLKHQEEYLNRTDDTPNADGKTAFELIHENGQNDLRAFIAGTLIINPDAYEKMEEFIRVFAGDYKDEDMVKLRSEAIDKLNSLKAERKKNKGEATSQLLNSVSDDEQQQEKPDVQNAWDEVFGADNFSNQDQNEAQDNYVQDNAQTTDEPDTKEFNSDEWKQVIDGANDGEQNPIFLEMMGRSLDLVEGMEISSLREVLGDDFPKNFADLSKEEKEDTVQQLRSNLSAVNRAKFNAALLQKSKALAETLPPHQLTVMVQDIDKGIKQNQKAKDEDTKEILENLAEQKNILFETMLKKTVDYVRGDTIIDISNVADVYDGAMEMFDYIDSQAPEEERLKALTKAARDKMEPVIQQYDELNGLQDIKEGDEKVLDEAFSYTYKIVSGLNFDNKDEREEWFGSSGSLIDSLQFEGEDAAEKKAIFIDTIKATAVRNVALHHKGKDKETLKQELKQELDTVGTAYYNSLVTANALANLPEKASKQEQEAAVANSLSVINPQISNKGLIAFQSSVVNQHISLLNRLVGKDKLKNRAAAVVNKMYGSIEKIDKTCIARFGSAYVLTRKFGQIMMRNMGNQALNQLVRVGCNAGSLALGAPGVGSGLYAAYYAGQSVCRFYTAYKAEKAAADKVGAKYDATTFLSSKAPEIALSAAGVAVSVFGGAVAQHGLEAAVRYGMIGAGWTLSVFRGIRASRKNGESWKKAISKSITNATLSTTTAVATGMAIAAGANNFSNALNGVHSDTWGEHTSRVVNADEYNADDPSYSREVLNGDLDQYKEMTAEQLNEQGIIKEELGNLEDYVGKSDADLAKEGIIRTVSDDEIEGGIKIIDQPASTQYADGVTAHAAEIVERWTSADPQVYQDNMVALNDPNGALAQWNAAHPEQAIDANRLELIIGDAGGRMVRADVDTLQNHVNGDMNNENPVDVRGNHKVFGDAWLEAHGENLGINAEHVSNIAALHDADGRLDLSKMTDEVLASIAKLDENVVSKNNEVLDVESTRAYAHDDGFLHQNAVPDANGAHVHSDDAGDRFNTYANGGSAKVHVNEVSHFERFEQLSQVEQHNFIPFTVTWDKVWNKFGGFNKIMGAWGHKKQDEKSAQQPQEIAQKQATSESFAKTQNHELDSAQQKPEPKGKSDNKSDRPLVINEGFGR